MTKDEYIKEAERQGIPNIIQKTDGKINEYRRAQVLFQGGSYKDKSWNRNKHWHECCKSMVVWRHKAACPKSIRNAPDDYSDLKDPNLI